QPAQQHLREPRVTNHVSANEFCDFAAAAHAGYLQPLRQDLLHLLTIVNRRGGWAVFHDVDIAVRSNHNVARLERQALAAREPGPAPSFGEQVVDDDMADADA